MTKLFGTDGVRGLVNIDLTSDLALKLGASVAHILKKEYKKEKLTFFIGCDTRISKDMLKSAVISGFLSEGCDIIDLDILPTLSVDNYVNLVEEWSNVYSAESRDNYVYLYSHKKLDIDVSIIIKW